MKGILTRAFTLLLTVAMILASLTTAASAKTVEEWMAGYETGAVWFGDDFAYDITDEAACWDLLMKPITVLDVGQTETVSPRVTPNGEKVNTDKLGGTINGQSAAVHVLGEDEDGWTLIEGLDYYNRLIRGYVRTKLLKTATPNEKYGIIIDKLYQRLYVFIDGKLWSSCAVSTGLPNDTQPYNETAAGEYLMVSRVGGFNSEGMICDMALRFNGGDMMHQVPYNILADGTKKFTKWEAQLGQRASHGCVRVARTANADGLNQQWLWENIKLNTKVLVWDDEGREQPYPDDSFELYYNKDGGQYYHSTAYCSSVRDKYLPLTAFTYGELDVEPYASLTACPSCSPAKRKAEIDALNLSRGVITQEQYDERIATHEGKAYVANFDNATAAPDDTAAPDAANDPQTSLDNNSDDASGEVQVVILD